MSQSTTRALQRALNYFTIRYVDGVPALHVDGVSGPATRKRIRQCKYWLGYQGKTTADDNHELRERLWHPKDPRYSTKERIARGNRRRSAHRREWRQELRLADGHDGVVLYDGVPCAAIAVPILNWCREHGWNGVLVSGWRSPHYSRGLCIKMCGAPSCPGMCAGESSNHVGVSSSRFALDVTEYSDFENIVVKCQLKPRIKNLLDARDPVHFSPSGN